MNSFPKWLAYLLAVCAILVTASILWSQRYVPLANGPLYLDRWRGVVCSPTSCFAKTDPTKPDPLAQYRDSVAKAGEKH